MHLSSEITKCIDHVGEFYPCCPLLCPLCIYNSTTWVFFKLNLILCKYRCFLVDVTERWLIWSILADILKIFGLPMLGWKGIISAICLNVNFLWSSFFFFTEPAHWVFQHADQPPSCCQIIPLPFVQKFSFILEFLLIWNK